MQSSRDSSVWRTLAVAFGDGLAFGAGVTLTRSAARLAAPRSTAPDLRPLNDRLSEIEQRIEHARTTGTLPVAGTPLNHKAADAVLRVIDGRFTEIGGQIDRRLAELEVKIKIELGSLDAQDHSLAAGVETRLDGLRGEIGEAIAAERQSIDADMRTLRAQMAAIHKEFAETLARLVDEQITKTVASRLQTVEEQLRETIREEIRLNSPAEQIAGLRERVESQERNALSLVMAFGRSCLEAAERIAPAEPEGAPPPLSPPEPPPPSASGGAGAAASPPEIRAEPAADPDLPGFARARSQEPLWRIPIVSCFLFATGSLLLLHYL
jgi:tetrahydromethanopterin S-methyltransferase subunit G